MPLIDEDLALRIEDAKRRARSFSWAETISPDARASARREEEERMREMEARAAFEANQAALQRMEARPTVALPGEGPVVDAWRRNVLPQLESPVEALPYRRHLADTSRMPPLLGTYEGAAELESADREAAAARINYAMGAHPARGFVPSGMTFPEARSEEVARQQRLTGTFGSPAERAERLRQLEESLSTAGPRQEIGPVTQYLGGAGMAQRGGGSVELYPPSEDVGLYPTLPITPPIR